MCKEYTRKEKRRSPSRPDSVWTGPEKVESLVWAGFAQSEKLRFWTKVKGGTPVDVPADRFAERNDRTGELAWEDVPAGKVIRAIRLAEDGKVPIMKIVTRASTPEELARFEHPRMPLLEDPLYSAEHPPEPDLPELPTRPVKPPEPPRPQQQELF